MEEPLDLKSKTRQGILTGILWLLTVVLGVLSFFSGRRVILETHSRFTAGEIPMVGDSGFSLMNILVSFVLAFLVIAIVIGGFEYHFRRAGTEESRWMFARTLAVEAGILLLAFFL